MRLSPSVLSLIVPLSLSTVGGPFRAEPVSAAHALAQISGKSRGCTFSASFQEVPGFPPKYDVLVTREVSSTCLQGAGSTVVGTTYTTQGLSLVATEQGVAISFTDKGTPSGSGAIALSLVHLAPDTLTVVRATELRAVNSGYAGYIYGGDLTIRSDGTTLEVRGTKSGTILGETGSGPNYVATYKTFFTRATSPKVTASP